MDSIVAAFALGSILVAWVVAARLRSNFRVSFAIVMIVVGLVYATFANGISHACDRGLPPAWLAYLFGGTLAALGAVSPGRRAPAVLAVLIAIEGLWLRHRLMARYHEPGVIGVRQRADGRFWHSFLTGIYPARRDMKWIASSDADCVEGHLCDQRGLCRARDGRCVADSAEKCRASYMCGYRGLCSLSADGCVAATDADCPPSEGCEKSGLCVAREGACSPSAEGCRRSYYCRIWGSCVPDGARCVARSDADCSQSEYCPKDGRCTARDGSCVQGSEADCRQSEYFCKFHGQCSLGKDECIATSADDCARSVYCRTGGDCALVAGHCVHP